MRDRRLLDLRQCRQRDPCTICRDERRDPTCSSSSKRWPISGRSNAPARFARAIMCSAERCRRSTASGRRISISPACRAGREGGDRGGDSRRQRHSRWPDDRALHHRSSGAICGSRSRGSRMACRSAANSIISTRARSRRRSGVARPFSRSPRKPTGVCKFSTLS